MPTKFRASSMYQLTTCMHLVSSCHIFRAFISTIWSLLLLTLVVLSVPTHTPSIWAVHWFFATRPALVPSMQIIGDVKDKNVVIIDDMVDTAGTITKAADIMKEAGAKTVRACASHCVMSGPASERVQNSALEEIVFTDSIPYTNRCSKVKQLSVTDMFAETILRVINNESISDQYLT